MKNNILKVLKKELSKDLYENSCSLFEKSREGDFESLISFIFIVNVKNDCFTFAELKKLSKQLFKNSDLKKGEILLLLTANNSLFKDIISNILVSKNNNIELNKVFFKEKKKTKEYEEYSGCGYSGCGRD